MHDYGLIQLAFGWIGQDWSNSPNGKLDWSVHGLGLSNFSNGGSDDDGLFVLMLRTCPFDRLNDPLRGVCRAIILEIRSFSFLHSHFLFRKVYCELSEIDFVVTNFDPTIFHKDNLHSLWSLKIFSPWEIDDLWFHLLKPSFDSIWVCFYLEISSILEDSNQSPTLQITNTPTCAAILTATYADLPFLANTVGSLANFSSWFSKPKTITCIDIVLCKRLFLCFWHCHCLPQTNIICFLLWC